MGLQWELVGASDQRGVWAAGELPDGSKKWDRHIGTMLRKDGGGAVICVVMIYRTWAPWQASLSTLWTCIE